MTLSGERVTQVLGPRTDVAEALATAESCARRAVDPALLELCEQRVAELLGAPRPPSPPDADELTPAQRACVAFTEQWVVDVASMGDELPGAVAAHLGDDGLVDFAHALLVVEQRLRLDLAWRRLGLGT